MLAAAFLLVGVMYCGNRDMGGDARSPRGDGVYRPVLARGDGHLSFLLARSLLFDGDLRLENDLARFGDPFRNAVPGRRATVPHPIGPPLVWIPLLALAQGAAAVGNALGAGIELHGYTEWHQRIAFSVSPLSAILAISLAVGLARRLGAGRYAAAYAGAAVLLGTALTYYATFMPSYAHALDAGCAASFLAAWAATLGRWDWRRALVVGGLLGAAALVRTQELGLAVVVALEATAAVLRPPSGERARWRWRARVALASAAMAAVALLVLVPQALAWNDMFGAWTSLPQGPGYTRPRFPMVAELLFAARNGFFAVHPLAYAGAVGLLVLLVRGAPSAPASSAASRARVRLVAAGLLLALATQVYLSSIILDWWGQASFGQRRLCSMTLPLVVGLASLLGWGGSLLVRQRWTRALAHGGALVGCGWFVAWNLARVWPLHGGKPAQVGAGPACCRGVGQPFAAIAQPVYDLLGNPFALPASAWFAWRHDVPLSRWDLVQGDYPWLPPMDYTPGTLRGQSARLALGAPRSDKLVVRGLDPGQAASGLRWTTATTAEILVPNLLPEALELELALLPGGPGVDVALHWNGREVASLTLVERQSVRWMVAGDVGINTLTVRARLVEPSAQARTLGAPNLTGVALGELRFWGR